MNTDTETETHDVVVTQHYAEREFQDASGAAVHIVVTTSQVAGKSGIDRQLHLEITQPQKKNGQTELLTVRKNLSWEDVEQLKAAADRLAGVAEKWRSTPSSSRNYIEFSTTVVDGVTVGRRTGEKGPEYFVAATDERQTARCGLGALDALTDFVCYVLDAANHLR